MSTVVLAGSTGSIGTQSIDVISRSDGHFRVGAIGAGSNVDLLVEQANAVHPDAVGIVDASRVEELRSRLDASVEVFAGEDAMAALVHFGDTVVNGIVGFAGLGVTIETLKAGKRLALANKESLIAAGPIVNPLRQTPGAELVPVDSEHCALHQCLRSGRSTEEVSQLVLTASGGPFRETTESDLQAVTVQAALAHPTWSMGPKITVDSSTLMNKGLEVIEAHELFGVSYDQIEVVVHPESIVHSMVSFTDGATIAQLSLPDMRLPIEYALTYPARGLTPFGAMNFSSPFELRFEPPRRSVFRCLDLAYAAGRMGETAPAWISAANEVCVDAFLAGRIRWSEIALNIERSLDRWSGQKAGTIADVLAADEESRRVTQDLISNK